MNLKCLINGHTETDTHIRITVKLQINCSCQYQNIFKQDIKYIYPSPILAPSIEILTIDKFLFILFLSANFLLCFSSIEIPFLATLSGMSTSFCHWGLLMYSWLSGMGTLALPTQGHRASGWAPHSLPH